MGKNDRDMRECVKHSLDARLSGLTSVPFLEQRVLAGEEMCIRDRSMCSR